MSIFKNNLILIYFYLFNITGYNFMTQRFHGSNDNEGGPNNTYVIDFEQD